MFKSKNFLFFLIKDILEFNVLKFLFAIEADKLSFQFYRSGVYTASNCGTNLDHGVLLVGYGEVDGNKYWKVKNSWGTVWGDEGYIKLGRGDEYNNGSGQCGMLMQASYPEV